MDVVVVRIDDHSNFLSRTFNIRFDFKLEDGRPQVGVFECGNNRVPVFLKYVLPEGVRYLKALLREELLIFEFVKS